MSLALSLLSNSEVGDGDWCGDDIQSEMSQPGTGKSLMLPLLSVPGEF